MAFAQDRNAPPDENSGSGWRRLSDTQAQVQQDQDRDDRDQGPDFAQGPSAQRDPNGPPPPPDRGQPPYRGDRPYPYPNPNQNDRGYPGDRPYAYEPQGPRPVPPPQLNVAPGTFFTIRLNQPLSSDHNQVGDAFTAQLVKPIVVDGFIIADRGQTIMGRVAEVSKGGRVEGTSRLGIELTELTLVDGQQISLRSSLISHTPPSSIGRDAAAIGTTTGIGAIIGAGAAGGEGAAIGAGAGAAASVIGVLLTRGHPTVIYPESVLTFRVEAPLAINTTRAPGAFRVVEPVDYNTQQDQPRLQTRAPGYGPNPYYGPYYAGPYYGPGWGYSYGYGYPYYYGPSVGFVFRGGGYRGGGFRGGGFRGRR